ncbi:MAG: MraY family glycosyltransferase [Candidatus Kerfeldbacteria bacterium]
MSTTTLIIITATMLLSMLFSVAARKLALKFGFIDVPKDPRKVHKRPTPLIGGAAVITAFIVGIFIAWPSLVGGYMLPKHLFGVISGALVLLVGGVLDDKFDLSPKVQVVFPVISALIVIVSGIGIDYITNPIGGIIQLDQYSFELFTVNGLPYKLTLLADAFTIVWLMGTMYTTKFLDGLDGLVSGVAVIGSGIIAVLSMTKMVYQPETAYLAALAGAAFLGFLFLNWHPAKIFLGESGSLFAGFILGVLAIISGGKIATAIIILGIPIMDVIWVIIRRLFLERRSPFEADRKHLHLRLIDIGLSHRETVLMLYAFTLIFGISSLFLQSTAKVMVLALIVVTMIILASSIVVLSKRKKQQ